MIALIPYFVLHTLADFLPPISLIGFALTIILMTVGLVEQFSLDRKTVTSLMFILASIFAATWIGSQIRSSDLSLSGSLRVPSSVEATTQTETPLPDTLPETQEPSVEPLEPEVPIVPESDPNLVF